MPRNTECDQSNAVGFQFSLRALAIFTAVVAAALASGYYLGIVAILGLPIWTSAVGAIFGRKRLDAAIDGFGFGFLLFVLSPFLLCSCGFLFG